MAAKSKSETLWFERWMKILFQTPQTEKVDGWTFSKIPKLGQKT